MGDGIIRKRVEHGTVWVTVRVAGHLYDVAAQRPDHWGLSVSGGIQHGLEISIDESERTMANALVAAWARDHMRELEPLFVQAERERQAKATRWAEATLQSRDA